jgi:hypothetical protein
MRRDARERNIPALPYLVLMPFLGSVATLGYFVHRALKSRSRETAVGSVNAISR